MRDGNWLSRIDREKMVGDEERNKREVNAPFVSSNFVYSFIFVYFFQGRRRLIDCFAFKA